MKQQSLSISIPEPCHENWSEMSPVEKGRHCQSCQKTVVDFTRMPKVEIAEFIAEQNGNLCGRFSSDQLNVELIPPKPSKSWLKYAAIILGLLPTVGYGQEVIVPEKTLQEKTFPPITGDIFIETKGEIVAESNPVKEEINIKGRIVDFDTRRAILDATVKNVQINMINVIIPLDKNGKFNARIPKNSLIGIFCRGYIPQVFKYAELATNNNLIISLKKDRERPMGMIELNLKNSKSISIKDRVKTYTYNSARQIKKVEEIKKIKTQRQNIIRQPVNSEIEESYKHVFSTVEIVALKTIITKGAMVCVRTVQEEKDNWFVRQWKKFKSLVEESHEEAVKNRNAEAEKPKLLYETKLQWTKSDDFIEKNQGEEKNDPGKKTEIDNLDINNINVYPNPGTGLFTLDLPQNLNEFHIEVTNSNNQLILRKEHTNFNGTLDLSNYDSGSYIVSIIADEQLISSHMVVKI